MADATTVTWVDDVRAEHTSTVVEVYGDYLVVDFPDPDNPGVPTTRLWRGEVSVVGCGSCGEDGCSLDECPTSERVCGHHCNHIWEQDLCDWCGKEFGEAPGVGA